MQRGAAAEPKSGSCWRSCYGFWRRPFETTRRQAPVRDMLSSTARRRADKRLPRSDQDKPYFTPAETILTRSYMPAPSSRRPASSRWVLLVRFVQHLGSAERGAFERASANRNGAQPHTKHEVLRRGTSVCVPSRSLGGTPASTASALGAAPDAGHKLPSRRAERQAPGVACGPDKPGERPRTHAHGRFTTARQRATPP